jgi:hypothetical protein
MNGILAIGKLYEGRLSPVIFSFQQLESHLFWISDKVDMINVNANGLSACDQLIAVSSIVQTLRLHIGRSVPPLSCIQKTGANNCNKVIRDSGLSGIIFIILSYMN